MNKIFKDVLVIVSAIIGLVAVIIAVFNLLGIDTGFDCPVCNCKERSRRKQPAPVPQTRIKRHYTEIKLPKEE